MAAELEAPTDKLTGTPFPLLPPETGFIDSNHQIFHSDEPELQTIGGRAIRQGRIQYVDVADHVIFHRHYGKIKIPSTAPEQFSYLSFIVADYIHPYAIDARRKKPWIRKLDEPELNQLRSGQIQIASHAVLGKFFADYAAEQDLSNSKSVDEFLNTAAIDGILDSADRSRRRAVATWMLKEALIQALDPLRDDFKKAKQVGSVAVKNFDQLPYRMFSMIGAQERDKFMKLQWSKLAREIRRPQIQMLNTAEVRELEQAA